MAFKLIRNQVRFDTATSFYDSLFDLMNAEFPRSTLIWSIENKMIHIKCKYKGCRHKLSYSFDVNEKGEMFDIRRKIIKD